MADLTKRRSTLQGSITKIKNFLEANSAKLNVYQLQCRLSLLESYFEEAMSIQREIEKDDSETDLTKWNVLEDSYCTTKANILELIDQHSKPLTPTSINTQTSFSTTPCHSVKLPKLKLPEFSGRYTEWTDFINAFTTLVDKNSELSDIEKFAHLRSCLSERPLKVIKALETSPANYQTALTLLKSRYDNKGIILQTHIREIFELPTVSKGSGTQLRNIVDSANAHLRALQSLGKTENVLDAMLLHLMLLKVDIETRSKWEEHKSADTLPNWDEFSKFLNNRSTVLESSGISSKPSSFSNSSNKRFLPVPSSSKTHSSLVSSSSSRQCLCCNSGEHSILQCSRFVKMSPVERYYEAKRLRLCLTCLCRGHPVKKCSEKKCSSCGGMHHILLHRPTVRPTSESFANSSAAVSAQNFSASNENKVESLSSVNNISSLKVSLRSNSDSLETSNSVGQVTQILLATATVLVRDNCGTFLPCRALLDSASQVNFVTERLVQRLQLKRLKVFGDISGIGDTSARVRHKVATSIRSRVSDFSVDLEFWTLSTITDLHPKVTFEKADLNIPNELKLADPMFNKPQKVDILLGAEVFFELLESGQIKLGSNSPILQETKLGWIVSGVCTQMSGHTSLCSSLKRIAEGDNEGNICSISKLLDRFWVIESINQPLKYLKKEQQECEDHFLKHILQSSSGQLIVSLPFRKDPSCLGLSSHIAYRRFLNLEKRLERMPDIKSQYSEFMLEYENLDHMEEVKGSILSSPHYIMPHHCVLRPESSTTKLRVVFDASCRTNNNVSLNEIMTVGPTVQPELFEIVFRFRLKKYALTADVSKMYRQILLASEDRNFQCIYWRNNPQDPLRIYRLKTVTYGTAAAPYLATRCLNYLADSENAVKPTGAKVIKSDFYVDDMLTGANTIEEAQQIIAEVTSILACGKLELRKWCSNEPRLLEGISEENREKMLRLNNSDFTKALGIAWNPIDDIFQFFVSDIKISSPVTKRQVLSIIARIFDPLGLINPITVLAKVFMQELWILKTDWDEPLPQEKHTKFEEFCHQLHFINQFKIPRFVSLDKDIVSMQLHGFCDASERAYGCCIYLRTVNCSGQTLVKLLCAKSRVAPIKTISLPRLELCGAQLLAQLLHRIVNNFGSKVSKTICWTDSKIVLEWLAEHPSQWTTFVANRVSLIQQLSANTCWNHVPSGENPADLVSRGVLPQHLLNSNLWFNGPNFLALSESNWPKATFLKTVTPEKRNRKSCLVISSVHPVEDIIKNIKYVNSFKTLQRTIAFVLRFINNSKKTKDQRITGELTTGELEDSLRTMIWNLQQIEFKEDYLQLQRNLSVSLKSPIKSLNAFLDECSKKRLIRVGGRLQKADHLPVATKFPILLPKKHPFTSSLIAYLHLKNFHAGPQALVAIIRQRFWIVNARDVVRKEVHRCLRCFRSKPLVMNQLMGNLPAHRIEPARPFINAGVDFAGPIWIHFKVRGKRPEKAYISLFICFSTKAIHLEVVSNLTAEAFIAALKRFIARRGRCQTIYCDNATNFIGANRQLKELHKMFNLQQNQDLIRTMCAEDGITFRPIPPRSPHFGGLWEAAIKSAKSHLYKTVNSSSLTFEELATVAAQIEAILNSRPITAFSSDPSDLEALTPGHFLIGEPLTSIVEPDITNLTLSRLSRWQRICALSQQFWKRWSSEYVVQLQQRAKWKSSAPNVAINTLVLIADDDLPPQKWLLGRIVEVFKGPDGKVRVVSIKTKNGIFKRAIHRICALPIETQGQ